MNKQPCKHGKLDVLNSRFRNHTCKLSENHGLVNIGYRLPMTNTKNKLVYLLAYSNRDAREKSWKEFMADPDWQTAAKESEKDGKLVLKADFLAHKSQEAAAATPKRARTRGAVYSGRLPA
jgi:hypothetical protein